MKDHYKTLGISSTASEKEIKSAYRQLAVKYHPDKNNGDKSKEEKFKEINEAYEILGDDTKRKAYDYGTHKSKPYTPPRPKGRDIFSKITITEADAKSGVRRVVKILKKEKCKSCNGEGAVKSRCNFCSGSGSIVKSFTTSNGEHKIKNRCPVCKGEGQVAYSLCIGCHGIGARVAESSVEIIVPPDFKAASIRIVGKGLAYEGLLVGDPGDLIVYIHIRK